MLPTKLLKLLTITATVLSAVSTQATSVNESESWLAKMPEAETAGHLKYQAIYTRYPEDSLLHSSFGSESLDHNIDLRLQFKARRGAWGAQLDYQSMYLRGDSLSVGTGSNLISDEKRLWNLTEIISQSDQQVSVQRLDRLFVDYRGEKTVWRIGRQVLSWGNGLMYNPVDVFNPFDPAALDREYKSGDDMLYSQYLFDSGADLQGVWVVRRDAQRGGKVKMGVASQLVKYHQFSTKLLSEGFEFDVMAGSHYDDSIMALGLAADVAGAVWRSDLSVVETEDKLVSSLVASVSYSWLQWGKNVSGVGEFFHNGFGLSGGDYSPTKLQAAPQLLARLSRGELYTLAKNYLALGLSVEMTPLLLLSPNVFINLNDNSGLLQLQAQYNRWENIQILLSASISEGKRGSEYGGITTPVQGMYLSRGPSLFLQLGWYF